METKQFLPIVCTRVYASDYQKDGTLTAEIKQQVQVTTEYINSANNGFTDDLFDTTKKYTYKNLETRVAWIIVPDNVTQEDVQAKIDKLPNAVLYKILSNYPILSENDNWAINNNIRTTDDYAQSQIVRYPSNHELAGNVVLDPNGKYQYRRIGFSANGHDDVDLRTQDIENQYIPSFVSSLETEEIPF